MPKKAYSADVEAEPVPEAPTMVRCKVTGFDRLVMGGKTYPRGSVVEMPAESVLSLKDGLSRVEDDTPLTVIPDAS